MAKKKDYSFDASRSIWANNGFRGYKNDVVLIMTTAGSIPISQAKDVVYTPFKKK